MEHSLKKGLGVIFLTASLLGHVENPEVVAGSATFEKPTADTQVIRAADKTAINCKSFNIGKNEKVSFVQPHSKARVLCRVTGKDPSIIEGRLEANGRLFLVNPNSIYFRETAQLNIHSLIASTLNIRDDDFVAGNYRFFTEPHSKDSAVINKGQITAGQDVVFLAPQIYNQGIVQAQTGHVAFLGGELITLNFEGDNLISFAIDGPLKNGFIEQAGQITAANGQVFLHLRDADEMIKSVVNINGLIQASVIEKENGIIRFAPKSSIAAKEIGIKGRVVESCGDYTLENKLTITAQKDLRWAGGSFTASSKKNTTEVNLTAVHGGLFLNSSFGDTKSAPSNILHFKGKTIDQNGYVQNKGPTTYSGERIQIGSDIYAPNYPITFNGPVVIDADQVKIASGRSKGDITFNGTVNGDRAGRTLTIYNGESFASVFMNGPVGQQIPLDLTIGTARLTLHNIGNINNAGAGQLDLKAKHNIDFLGSVVHANEQKWDAANLNLKGGQLTTFITEDRPLTFTSGTKVNLDSQTSVSFETRGGDLELRELTGEHEQDVKIFTGHGDARIGNFKDNLGSLHVESRNIYYTEKIEAGNIFMEAQDHINYEIAPLGKTNQTALISKENITLNAKHGMIGTNEMPVLIHSKGKTYVGSKAFAYINGTCKDDVPSFYGKNQSTRIVFNGREIQNLPMDDVFTEELEFISLAPDLFHAIPSGFVDKKSLMSRRAPIYYQVQ